MIVKIFANASNKNEAIEVYKNFINIINEYIKFEKLKKIEPYWKFKDMYIVEVSVDLHCQFGSEHFDQFLYRICDKWEHFGNPIDELLASASNVETGYILENVEMINIFLN